MTDQEQIDILSKLIIVVKKSDFIDIPCVKYNFKAKYYSFKLDSNIDNVLFVAICDKIQVFPDSKFSAEIYFNFRKQTRTISLTINTEIKEKLYESLKIELENKENEYFNKLKNINLVKTNELLDKYLT